MRAALTGRAAHWYEKALPALDEISRAKYEKRIAAAEQSFGRGRALGVTAQKLVVWNANNAHKNNWGTRRCDVILRRGQETVWKKEGVEIAWREDEDAATAIRLPDKRFDAVRIAVTEWTGRGGALVEVELRRGDRNLCDSATILASASDGAEPQYGPRTLLDGDVSSAKKAGWYLPRKTAGWVELRVPSAIIPDRFALDVVTTTGSHKHAGTDDLPMHLLVNGREDVRFRLENPDVNDCERNAIDAFRGLRVNMPLSRVEDLKLVVDGKDAWFCKSVEFRFHSAHRTSRAYVFPVGRWFSGELADIRDPETRATQRKVFKVKPRIW